MPAKPLSQIITANDLLTGEVVYLTKTDTWTCHLGKAMVIDRAELSDKRLEQISSTDTSIVGPYLAAVKLGRNHTPAPVHLREVFRATGPTNHFIGTQAHV